MFPSLLHDISFLSLYLPPYATEWKQEAYRFFVWIKTTVKGSLNPIFGRIDFVVVIFFFFLGGEFVMKKWGKVVSMSKIILLGERVVENEIKKKMSF